MANESVKFYRGDKADLPLKGDNGSIYIAEDTGEMYMDTQDTSSNASSGEAVAGRVKIKDTTKAPINHASSGTSYGVSSASNYGHAKASSTTPKANGTASAGSETSSFARGDHVHPLQTSVTNATKATQDSAGQQIDKTYIKNLSVSGKTITYTKGDGTTGTITTQDTNTTYGAATSSTLGLVKSGGDVTVDSSGNMSVTNDSHTHSNSTISSLDASKLTGTISIDRLPKGALERLVPVENQSARFALTTSDVQLGDTVQQLDTGVMYLVVNESELDNEAGYKVYTAGSATSVPWSGVTGKPSTFTPSTHSHTISQITDIKNASVASAVKATQDSAGQDIDSTYIKGLSVNGRTVTYTKGDGTTGSITTQDTNTTYSNATTEAAGLMSAADKAKLDGIASGANKYTHPSYTAKSSGLYKVTVDSTGHVSATSAVTKSDITALGIPAQDTNTTYSAFKGATSSAAGGSGLVPAPAAGDQTKFLKADGTWSTPPATTLSSLGITATASELNYMDGVTSNVQTQLNSKAASGHTHTKSQITDFPASLKNPNALKFSGASTASYDGSSAVTVNIPTTSATPNAMTVQLNGGTTEGTNKFTFNGSAAATVNVTPSAIGAATSGHTHAVASTSAAGFLNKLNGSTSQYLRGDGTWATPPNTTYSNMGGASSSAAGKAGLVPAPAAGASNRYLRSDGTWAVPPDTNTTYTLSSFGITATASELNYMDGVTSNVQTQLNGKASTGHSHSAATTGAAGFMSAADKSKLDGIASGANKYSLPLASESTRGGVKVGYSTSGKNYAVQIDDEENLFVNVPWTDTNTTYGAATTSTAGLMSAADKTKLDGIATGANKYTHPAYTAKSSGLYKVTVDSTGHVSATAAVTKADITALGIPGQDTNTTYSAFTGATTSAAGSSGLVPAPATGSANRYLRSDGTWAVPPDTNTTYSNMTGASSSAAGKAGLVPAPSAGASNRYLRSDGTWQVPPDTNTTYTLSSFGITATAAELNKLDGVTATATEINYLDGVTSSIQSQLNGKAASSHSHSNASTSAAGFLRQLNGSTTQYLRGDGTWATPPDTNTTYSGSGGISVSGTTISHSNSITAGNAGPTANATPAFGSTFTVPYFAYDARGHITSKTNRTVELPTPITSLSSATSNTSVLGAKVVADAITKLEGLPRLIDNVFSTKFYQIPANESVDLLDEYGQPLRVQYLGEQDGSFRRIIFICAQGFISAYYVWANSLSTAISNVENRPVILSRRTVTGTILGNTIYLQAKNQSDTTQTVVVFTVDTYSSIYQKYFGT